VIQAFSISPNSLLAGECLGISWSVGGGATFSRILRNGVVIIDDAGYSGQQMDCLDAAGTYTYRLEASNAVGESVSQEQVATVTEAAPDNPLAGTAWQATALYDAEVGGIGVVLPGTSLTVAFGPGGGVNGSSGCNSYSASYTVDGQSLSITPPGGTTMICGEPEGIMEQETAFLSALAAAGSFELSGNQLAILDASGQPVIDLVGMP
jgi:heat shock protein HslJ